jgi:hypothetical protein
VCIAVVRLLQGTISTSLSTATRELDSYVQMQLLIGKNDIGIG